ncbi:MAG: carbohydrate ABC transporter permease [Bacteroidales bacterium]|nr:carbohydrate ABC transporter permease [Bacteroidales bacterium]
MKDVFFFIIYILIAIFALFPLLWGLKLSLTPKYDYGFWPKSLTLVHYKAIFQRKEVIVYFLNSVKVALGTIVIVVPLSLMAAYALARFCFPGRRTLGMILLLLPMLPMTAILVPLVSYYNKLGLYNTIQGVILVNATFSLPLAVWMLRNFIVNTPKNIEEAALIDGLGPMQTLFRVTLPMIRPGVMTVIIYLFISSWNGYTASYALTTSPDKRVLAQGVLAFLGSWETDWGGLTAMGLLMVFPPILLFLCFQDTFIAGMFGESLK